MADAGDHTIPTDLGNAEHQRLLRAMTAYHARQPWARAFIVFGSVARGDWDAFSDLDLDVVIADDAVIDPVAEVARLCAAIGERPALVAPRRGDDAEVVLDSLARFSIRYHPLGATSPNILDSARILWGDLSLGEMREAGERNRRPSVNEPQADLALAVRAVLAGAIALDRGRLWSTLAALEECRGLLLDLYATTRDLPRALPAFELEGGVSDALTPLTASLTRGGVRAALLAACDLLAGDGLNLFTKARLALTPGERAVLSIVRERIATAS